MSDHRRIRSLGIEEPGRAYFFEYDEGPPADHQVSLRTLFTGFSAGTELTFFKNTNPYLHSRWDGDRGVFVAGERGVHYPVQFLGYMEVARVSQSQVSGFAVSDIVAGTWGHKTGHTADPFHELLIPLPPDIDPVLGIFVGQMGPIAANGILHADTEVLGGQVAKLGDGIAGRPVVVVGGGTVGLLTALFARKAGAADVIVSDPSAFRRGAAERLGLTALPEQEVWQYAKARWHHGGSDRGADFVFQTRPRSESLHVALQALRPQGTVIDLAFYQNGSPALRLGEEFHHNGLAIRCAQIGRVPRGLGHGWDRRRLALETLDLIRWAGPGLRETLITHMVPIDEAPSFLERLVVARPEFLQIVFEMNP